MNRFFSRQISEISSSRALSLYGAFLSIAYALSYTWWANNSTWSFLQLGGSSRICWPLLPCPDISGPSIFVLKLWLLMIFMLGLAAAFSFISERTRTAYFLLIALVLTKAAFFLQDFRLMGNYHYMPFWAALAFLFLPSKRALLPLLTVAFYLSAGVLKLNQEWLSGAAIPPWWPFSLGETLFHAFGGALWRVGALWVVVLELVFVLFLFSSRSWLRYFVFAQLLLFHAISYFIVDYFYPAVMACLLSIFPLIWREKSKYMLRPAALSFLAIFAVFQIIPWLIKGDTALTGEGRWFSLNMIDANPDCSSTAIVRAPGSTRDFSRDASTLFVRVQCDPYIYFTHAKQLCSELGEKEKLDINLSVRRASDSNYRVLIDEKDFCAKNYNYSMWRANDWIKR